MKQRIGIKLHELQQHRTLFKNMYSGKRHRQIANAFKSVARSIYFMKVMPHA